MYLLQKLILKFMDGYPKDKTKKKYIPEINKLLSEY
jgi:hypothetical protein